MVYTTDDIDFAINLLNSSKSTHPLLMQFVERDPCQDIVQNLMDHFCFAENYMIPSKKYRGRQ